MHELTAEFCTFSLPKTRSGSERVKHLILVCGGAGYTGSHAVHSLVKQGEEVVVVDNLQSGHRDAVH